MPVFFISLQLLLTIHAGSPNVTSLTFDDQSRTLTCTSTGGPATTVTWRRDGVVITLNATHRQTKKLVDTGNGTYQTVLTINSSVGWSNIVGTYNCTVENARGESSESVVIPGEIWTLLFSVHTPLCCWNLHVQSFVAHCLTPYVHGLLQSNKRPVCWSKERHIQLRVDCNSIERK